ncbi:hypothetical protein [Deinococcus multiflagellatus]|uniref:Uncharacterized protein n=1 Tax=Deinococcus multiflagellatus TaxID=1656887 RepID=A0ABW1ZKR5_9DEIO|nr:hypothetical protein [Deinococcus multiflagellatus]MBZ9716022.1 hypothetical protein [Deinococcus multiflagellatus]
MRIRPLIPLLLLGTVASAAAAPGTSTAGCQIAQLAADLGPYRAPTGARGTVVFRVDCPGTGRYAVTLSTPNGPLSGPVAQVRLRGKWGEAQALLTMPLDLTVTGSRTFNLSVQVIPGQWQLAGGDYEVPLTVSTKRLDVPPAGDTP